MMAQKGVEDDDIITFNSTVHRSAGKLGRYVESVLKKKKNNIESDG